MKPLLSFPWYRWFKPLAAVVFLFGIAGWRIPASQAAEAPAPIPTAPLTPCDLGRLCPPELDHLFAAGRVAAPPVGPARGKVLLVVDARNPKARAQMMSAVW